MSDSIYSPLPLPRTGFDHPTILGIVNRPFGENHTQEEASWASPPNMKLVQLKNLRQPKPGGIINQYDTSLDWRWSNLAIGELSAVKNYVETALPFQSTTYVSMFRAVSLLGIHTYLTGQIPLLVKEYLESVEPSMYFIAVCPEQTENLPWMIFGQDNKTNMVTKPTDTDVVSFSISRTKHVWYPSNTVFITIGGILDRARHNALVLEAKEKYPSFIF